MRAYTSVYLPLSVTLRSCDALDVLTAQVLLVDNVYRQQHVSMQSLLDTRLPFLILRVRRSSLVEDACRLLGSSDPRDLLRPLKVIFDGEEGVDEGGLRREFFSVRKTKQA